MSNDLEKNNFSVEASRTLIDKKKPLKTRPNIDHLIKRILDERREARIKGFFLTTAFLLVSAVLMAAFL